MDLDDRLHSILKSCAWLRDAPGAYRLAPGFLAEAPPLVDLHGQRMAGEASLPVLDTDRLAIPLAALMAELGESIRRGAPVAGLDGLSDEQIAADPLVLALVDPLLQCGLWAPSRSAVPALVLAWTCSRLLTAQDLGVVRIERSAASQITTFVAWLGQQPPGAAGKALSQLSWEVSGRMAAAIALAAEVVPALAQNRLLQQVVTDPLVLCRPKGSIDLDRDLPLVAAMLGLEGDLAGLTLLRAAVVAGHKASEERRAKGKANGADATLASLASGWDADRVLMDPVAGPFVIGALPELCSVKELRAAGVAANAARLMTRSPGAAALAAAWSDLLSPLLSWDLHAALVDRILPLSMDPAGQWLGPNGPVAEGEQVGMLVPRNLDDGPQHCIVAVRLSGIQRGVEQAALGRSQSSRGLARREWRRFAEAASAPAFSVQGDHGLAAFASAAAAWRFAVRAHAGLGGPRELSLVGPGSPVTLSREHGVSVGLGWGRLEGGFDGLGASFAGAAVADALVAAGLPGGAIPGSADPLGMRAAGLTPQGFSNAGIVATGAMAERLATELDGARKVLHRHGEGRAAAGLSQDFRLYPVMSWWEADGGKVGMAVALVDPPGPAPMVELKLLSRDAFAEFHRSDADAGRRAQAAPKAAAAVASGAKFAAATTTAAAPAAAPAAIVDPFASEPVAPVAAPAAAPQGMERVDSVFGFAAEAATDEIAPADLYEEELDAEDLNPRGGDLDMGLLDAFSQEGATGETPIMSSFEAEDGETPVIGKLALMDGDDPFSLGEDGPGGPHLSSSASPLVAIEDDWDEDDDEATANDPVGPDGQPDAFGGPLDDDADAFVLPESGWGSTDEPEVEDSDGGMAEGVLTDDFDDHRDDHRDGARGPELDMLQDPFGFQAPEAEEPDPFGFAPPAADAAPARADGPGFFDADEYTGFQDELGRPSPDRAREADDSAPAAEADLGFSFEYDADLLEDGGNTASGLWRGGDSLAPSKADGDAARLEPLAPALTLAPSPSPAPAPAPASSPAPAPAPAADDPLLNELVRMFKDYMVARQPGGFVFGIRDGARLRDAQLFSTGEDAQAAYGQFLQYKIRNGFVTEANKVVELAKDQPVQSIDGGLLRRAYVEVAR